MKLRTIVNLYDSLNTGVFADALLRPRILGIRNNREYASYVWQRTNRYIYVSLDSVKGMKMASALMFHEMVHQYVEEVLQVRETNPHGPIFWQTYLEFKV